MKQNNQVCYIINHLFRHAPTLKIDSPMPYSIPQSDCTGSQWQCFFEPLSSCALNESATSKELADYHQRGKSIVLGYMVDLSTGHKVSERRSRNPQFSLAMAQRTN